MYRLLSLLLSFQPILYPLKSSAQAGLLGTKTCSLCVPKLTNDCCNLTSQLRPTRPCQLPRALPNVPHRTVWVWNPISDFCERDGGVLDGVPVSLSSGLYEEGLRERGGQKRWVCLLSSGDWVDTLVDLVGD